MRPNILIPKDKAYEYFIVQNHTLDESAEFFNITVSQFRKILKKYGIKKVQEIIVDKEKLYDYYFLQNHTVRETMDFFGISKTCLCSKLKKYKIIKDEERKAISRAKFVSEHRKQVNKEDIIHFYIDLNYTAEETAKVLECSERILRRRLKEYGIKKDAHKKYENVSKSCLKNNGVSSPAKLEKFKNKMMETNKKRYGVPFACMREEYHKFKGRNSQINLNFEKKLQSLNINYEKEFNLENFLYDFKVGNILIELNPTVTHNSSRGIFNDAPKDKNYHLRKSRVAQENGFHCIHVFDWDNQNKIIELFLLSKDKVPARKCEIQEVEKEVADAFLEKYHLQGKSRGNIANVGLFFKDELVALMTFGKPRYNRNYQWELLRFCSSKIIVGGGAKILNYFEQKYKPLNIISYCDISKFDGDIYTKLGFETLKKSKPCKHWCYFGKSNSECRKHITDNVLRQRGFDQLFKANYGKGTSNEELMIQHNYVIVYDCGQITFVKKYKDGN